MVDLCFLSKAEMNEYHATDQKKNPARQDSFFFYRKDFVTLKRKNIFPIEEIICAVRGEEVAAQQPAHARRMRKTHSFLYFF